MATVLPGEGARRFGEERAAMKNRAAWRLAVALAVVALVAGGLVVVRLWPYWVAKYRGEMADLHGASLSGASLRGARLSRANLAGANLTRADLAGADLQDADLRRASLRGARLTRALLARANLTGASLPGS